MKMKINSVYTLCCDSFLVSDHVHDFVTCSCGEVSIDGGNDYRKRLGKKEYFLEILTTKDLTAFATKMVSLGCTALNKTSQTEQEIIREKFQKVFKQMEEKE